MSSPSGTPPSSEPVSVRDRVRRAFVTGVALTIPLVLTLVVLQIALNLVSQAVAPFVVALELVLGAGTVPEFVLEVATVLTLGVIVLCIGLVAEYRSGPGRLAAGFDALMARIPGLGSVYTGTRRMSEVLLEPDTEAFHEVKLVEFPREGSFMIGFLTARPPETIVETAGAEQMHTLFVPLAPNPVMGGFLVHLPDDRVHDVDLTVEQGVQSIVTSGTAIDPRVEDVVVGDGIEFDAAELLEETLLDPSVLDPDVVSGGPDERAGAPAGRNDDVHGPG